ncbi:MAG: 3-phosphoglycerate dehydrogenase family protein [Desulfobulbaceae bacterium]|nr:3-phosphoglycerate dehydrogenase family protein [Desulfobulbaceae bacterium]
MENLYRIKVMNAISKKGLALLGENYSLGDGEADPHGIVVRSSPVNLEGLDNLLAVARAGAGVNNIPMEEATEKGICVFNTPGANANAVVELVFTMLGIRLRNVHQGITFCQGLNGLEEDVLAREVEKKKKMFKGEEMSGKTLGVLGLGKIGVGVANAGVQHNMRVIGFDPFPILDNVHELSPAVEMVRSRAEMLRESDYISLHVPLNKNTSSLVSHDFLEAMKDGAVLLNYARGPVVDEVAVLEYLNNDKLAGFITDFPSPRVIDHPNVLVTPHLGASTKESELNCGVMAVGELKDYLEYGNVNHSVNFPNVESIPTVKVHTRLIMINRDQPGMIGQVTNILGAHKINIISFVNESNGVVGYNIIDCDGPILEEICREVEACDGVIRTRTIRFGKNCQPA